jgi:hypothetical protein
MRPSPSPKEVAIVWLIGIAFLVGGMAVSVGAPSDAREARQLEANGVTTTAEVTDVAIRRSGGRGSSRHAVLEVAFEDEFGVPAEASGFPFCGEPESVFVGDEVEIVYDPDDTEVAQHEACDPSTEITIPLVIGIVAILIGTYFVLRAWRANGWRRRWVGAIVLVLGILFVGTSLEEDCECFETIYTGGALVVIGAVPLVAPRASEAAALPPEPG